jgi:CxxC-x17-CxxC domain-containing protein
MAYFNRDNNRGGDRGFGKRDFGGGKRFGGGRRDFGDKPKPFMHQATCAECGNNCEVPFKPVPGRAVFCSNCFESRGNGGKPRFENSKPNFAEKRTFQADNSGKQFKDQFDQLNAKLDAILKALAPAEKKTEAVVEKEVKKDKKVKVKAKALKAKKKVKA